MSDMSSYNDSYDKSTSSNTSVVAKLRRLKIQEKVLSALNNKNLTKLDQGNEITCNSYFRLVCEFKKFVSHLKVSFIEIKNLLEDVKMATNPDENIEDLDINDVKKDLLELETKILSLKTYLRKEITSLKVRENEITNELNDVPIQARKSSTQTKIHTTQYKDIVPSPVRVLINSPFKCPAVQKLQEFLTKSPYGGWNNYKHKAFVQIWNKYFNNGSELPYSSETKPENTDTFRSFTEEVLQKIPGVKQQDVVSHFNWYSEYLSLKSCQQIALERWKENKRKIKAPMQHTKIKDHGSRSLMDTGGRLEKIEVKTKDKRFNVKNFDSNDYASSKEVKDNSDQMFSFMKPTKQWKNRRDDIDNTVHRNICAESKRQLRIPNWRMCLYQN